MGNSADMAKIFHSLGQANLVQIGLIAVFAVLCIFLGQRLLAWLANKCTGRRRLLLFNSMPLLRLLVFIATSVLIIPRLIEPTIENLVALLGALGLALGFAFKDYASSLAAGFISLYEMPYRPGDWIEVNGAYGEVRAINMRTVEIVTPDDTVVVIPHLKLWDQLIFNANDGGENLLCVADFYLHPAHDAVQVKHLLYDVALTSPFLQINQPVNVIVLNKPWGTHYRLKAYPIDMRQQFHFISDVTMRGKAALMGQGMEFVTMPAITKMD